MTPLDNPKRRIRVEVNGSALVRDVECRKHLVDFLREDCGLTGSHLGCEHGVCGACSVRLDGQVVRGCLVLAAQADGRSVQGQALYFVRGSQLFQAVIYAPRITPEAADTFFGSLQFE